MDPGKEEQENEEKMEIPQEPAVLCQLWQLERRARRGALRAERAERGRERRQLLHSRLRELRQRRDRLRHRLRLLEEGKAGIPWEPREVLHWRLRELQELLRLFPLTGVSGTLSRHGLSFSLHTSFQGCLLDSFQLELLPSRQFRELRIRRHSVPPFIPLQGLARQFLPGKLREFLALLLQHLNAFVARRQQLRLLQAEFPEWLQGIPSSNSLCNLLSFHCRIPGKNSQNPEKTPENGGKSAGNVLEFRARLLYGDPLRSLPTQVEVSGEGGRDAPAAVPELLRSRPLPGALRLIPQFLQFPPGDG